MLDCRTLNTAYYALVHDACSIATNLGGYSRSAP